MLTGAAKINDFRSKLAFRSRFARSGAHFYAQARWFRTLCTGAVVLQNCAKPSRLCTNIARPRHRRKLTRKQQVYAGIGAHLARYGPCCLSVSRAAGRQRPNTSTRALRRQLFGHLPDPIPDPVPGGSRMCAGASRAPPRTPCA